VLLDEPTVGVDPQSRNRIFEMIQRLRAEGMSAVYTTHYIEEAERLCDRVAIIDHGRIIAMGTRDDLVHTAFASRSEVLVQFATANGGAADWVRSQGGRYDAGKAQFMIEHPREILGLLDAAAKAGHELADISLRKPNLESVFLRLTGRELRD
jgi:ABC-2 type transport system ATP-binding protein